MQSCPVAPEAGAVRALLGTVDCGLRGFAHRGFDALSGGASFQAALTAVLTIVVASFGYRLLFARNAATFLEVPRLAVKIGLVLALVSNWALFDRLIFESARAGPEYLSTQMSRALSDPADAGDPVGALQVTFDQLSQDAESFLAPDVASAGPQAQAQSAAPALPTARETSARGERRLAGLTLAAAAAGVLFIGAGVIAGATVLLNLLSAAAPLFIVTALFHETRGLALGWLKAMAGVALVSLLAWCVDALMTSLSLPWLVTLARERSAGEPDARTAAAVGSLVIVFLVVELAATGLSLLIAFSLNPVQDGAAGAGARRGSGRLSDEPGASALVAEISRASALREFVSRPRYAHPVGLDVAPSSSLRARAAEVAAGAPRPTSSDLYRRPASARAAPRLGGSAT